MKFWPEKSFTIRTQLSPQEVVERLKNNTEKREINQIPRFNIPKYKPKGYIGLINNNNFTLYNNTTLYSQFFAERGSYILITGTIEAKDVGASITFKLQYDNGQKESIYILFIIALLIIIVVAVYHIQIIIWLALLIPAFAYHLFRYNLNFYARKNEEIFNTIFQY